MTLPEHTVRDGLDAWFGQNGKHGEFVRMGVSEGLASAARTGDLTVLISDSPAWPRPTARDLAVGERAEIDGMPSELDLVLTTSLEEAGGYGFDEFAKAAFRRRAPSLLVRVGSGVANFVLSTMVVSAVMAKIEELLYRDQIESELRSTWWTEVVTWEGLCAGAFDGVWSETNDLTVGWITKAASERRLVPCVFG